MTKTDVNSFLFNVALTCVRALPLAVLVMFFLITIFAWGEVARFWPRKISRWSNVKTALISTVVTLVIALVAWYAALPEGGAR